MASDTQTGALQNETLAAASQGNVRRFPPLPVTDAGKVRLGGQGPIFRTASIADAGRVRLGGQGPVFR